MPTEQNRYIRNLTKKAREFALEREVERDHDTWMAGYTWALTNLDDEGVQADLRRIQNGEAL